LYQNSIRISNTALAGVTVTNSGHIIFSPVEVNSRPAILPT